MGATTLFIRFAECDLRCRWCDSPHTWRPARRCRIELEPGSETYEERESPLSLDALEAAVHRLDLGSHRFVSLTGGEPLLQADVVREVAERLRGAGPRIALETHGAAPERLERVVDVVDHVSMDWKLASDVRRAGERDAAGGFHDVHEAFLRIAQRASDRSVKLVVTRDSRDEELDEAFERIARVDRDTCVVLQPVTPFGRVRERPGARRMLELARRAERQLRDVRVIPQTHPVYGAP